MQLFWYNCSLFCSFMERLALTFFFFSSLLISVSFSLHVPAIITFGDSIFDAGNNHFNNNCTAQADFPPYGSSFFHHPTGRFTNGRTVADFICEFIIYLYLYIYIHLHNVFARLIYFLLNRWRAAQFIGIELQKPYLEARIAVINGSRKDYPANGINFASAGSGVLMETNKDWVRHFALLWRSDELGKF